MTISKEGIQHFFITCINQLIFRAHPWKGAPVICKFNLLSRLLSWRQGPLGLATIRDSYVLTSRGFFVCLFLIKSTSTKMNHHSEFRPRKPFFSYLAKEMTIFLMVPLRHSILYSESRHYYEIKFLSNSLCHLTEDLNAKHSIAEQFL